MRLLELDIIEKEIDNNINYPEIPENYNGEICPYYLNKECIFLFTINKEKLENERSYFLSIGEKMSLEDTKKELDYMDFKTCFQYCPTNFRKCLAYDIISVGNAITCNDLFKPNKK